MKTNTIEPMQIILKIMQEKQMSVEEQTLIFSNPNFNFVAEKIAHLLIQQPENAVIIKELIGYSFLQASLYMTKFFNSHITR